jgi:copper chaperone CopZ
MTSAIYRVSGMTYEHCVRAVTAELNDLTGGYRLTGS